jgi:inhibitor of KinA sporulation pathway (predicted exonuclease)|tara:strand:+ start:1953 stop:2108 length:156 start_codon:yes stop_codon:yes gene_type:complete
MKIKQFFEKIFQKKPKTVSLWDVVGTWDLDKFTEENCTDDETLRVEGIPQC